MEIQQTQQINKLSPKFFFLSLGVLVTLITSVSSFLMLAFDTLDKKFPDVLNAMYTYGYNTYDYESIRGALATLIIIFPVFLLLSYFWNKASTVELGKIDATIQKWMIYLVLFLSAIVIVVDLVTLVRFFVSGEITMRFILKVAITLIVALFVGTYYVLELKGRKTFFGFRVGLWSGIKSSAWVIALIIFAFCVMGSPWKQRQLRLDERRLGDLQNMQWQVINYWQQKEKLPEKLQDLSTPLSGFSVPVDPEFEKGKMYEYSRTGEMSFTLCAEFSLPIPKGWSEYGGGVRPFMPMRDTAVSYPSPVPGGVNDSWDHEAGNTCFERTIDPDMYPPFSKQTETPETFNVKQ